MKKPSIILDFIRTHDAAKRAWEPELLEAWVRWFILNGFFFCYVNKNKELTGILMARPIASKTEYSKDYFVDPKGKIAAIDLAIFTTKKAARKLVKEAVQKIGFKKFLAFERNRNKKGVQLFSTKKTLEKLGFL